MIEPSVLGGRYELGDVLGRGGMAEVRIGRDNRLGRTVAVKMLRIDHATDPTFQARFRREAQSAASLNHPAIVAVYDTGEDHVNGLHIPYIVMEYVEGRTLRELVRDHSRFTVDRALEITAGILDALEYSHRAGIVHRDIKPGNVMINSAGDVKVMDFGIARALAETGATLTQTAAVVGTAQYLSPEQARGEAADARSDLYATGCVLYELLTGRPPFVGDSLVSVAVSHVREEPTPPSVIDPSIPRDVDAIVMKALAKDRLYRYQSASEMRADIQRVLAGLPVAADTASTQLIPGAALGPADDALPLPEEEEEERRGMAPWALALAALAVLGLGALIGFLLFQPDPVQQVRVPQVIGMTEQEAREIIENRGLEIGEITPEASADAEPGTVIRQDPDSGLLVDEGSTVNIWVSSGPEQVTVPELVGRDSADAEQLLADAGLRVGEIERRDSDRPAGEVLATNPEAGTTVNAGTAVNLVVSSGRIEVPNVVGLPRDEAEAILSRNFEVRVVERETDEAAENEVIRQEPSAGSFAEPGSEVVITVAQAPPPPPEPEPEPPTTPPATDITPPTTPPGGDGG